MGTIFLTSQVSESQNFDTLQYVLRTGVVPTRASMVPSQREASQKTWIFETGAAASAAGILSAALVPILLDGVDGPALASTSRGVFGQTLYGGLQPQALSNLRVGVQAYFNTAATVPAQSVAFIIAGTGAQDIKGIQVEVIANTGVASDFLASGASSSTYFFGSPVILTDSLFPIGAGGALLGPDGVTPLAASSSPVVIADGVIFGVLPRPAAAAEGDLVKVTVFVKW